MDHVAFVEDFCTSLIKCAKSVAISNLHSKYTRSCYTNTGSVGITVLV